MGCVGFCTTCFLCVYVLVPYRTVSCPQKIIYNNVSQHCLSIFELNC